MAKRNWQVAAMIAAILLIAGVVCLEYFSALPKLPSTVQLLSDNQMQNVRGGTDGPDPEPDPCSSEKPKKKGAIYIASFPGEYGVVGTDVPICTVRSDEGPKIDLVLHYNSGKADGSIGWWKTVMGYGWTHNYNIHLIVRSREVLMPNATGRMTLFRKRIDGGYTPSARETHTLSQVDSNTFLLEEVDGHKKTFKLFDPAPWFENGQLFQLTQVEDAQGRITTLGYNIQGLLETITDPYGRQVNFTYNANKRIETITNADGQVTQIEYQNADDDLWRITDPLSNTLEYTYDSQNRMTIEKLKDGKTWRCVYNSSGKPYKLVDGDGQIYATFTNSANWAIDLDHLLQFSEVRYIPSQTTVTDGCGNETVYHHNENGYVTKIENPDGTEKTYEFNDNLRRVKETDEEGNYWLYEYDEYGNRTKATDPLSNETQMFYEHATIPSLLTKKIESDGDIWEYEYDANGNMTKKIDPIIEDPNDKVITYTYNTQGQRISTTDRNDHLTQREYNPDGTLLSETVEPGGLDIITEYEYDALGRMTKQISYREPGKTDPVEEEFEYDALGRVIKETVDPNSLNLNIRYEYDGTGHRTRQTNPRGVITDYTYDVRGRLITEIVDPNGLNLTTQYEYDGCDNTTKLIDPNGNETRYEYDDRNRLIKIIDAEDYWKLYEYDTRDNRTRVSRSINTSGPTYRVIEYHYDELGRKTHELVDPNGLNLTTIFEYTQSGGDGCGCTGTPGSSLVYKKTDPAGKVTYYYYDQLDRLTSVVLKVGDIDDNGGDPSDSIIVYEYDYMGNRTKVTVENVPHLDLVTAYIYDSADRVIQQVYGTSGTNLTTTYSYDEIGNIIQQTTPVSNVISRIFDSVGRLTNQSDSNGVIITYTYDENSNILTQSDGLGHTLTHTYDNANRPITTKDPLVETPTDKYTTYEYDKNGNLTQETDNEGLVTTYSYDGLDRRITMTKDPLGQAISTLYAYDGFNNQTQITDDNANATTYEYDAANRKTRQIYADGTDILFGYDAASNLTSRTDQMDNVITYTYDDLNRLISVSYTNGRQDTYTYSRTGQLLTADNNHSHIGYAYDDVSRVISSTQTDLPQTYSYTVNYAYSETPNRRTITYPSGKVVVEEYDIRDRLKEVWQDGIKTTWYTYDNPDNRILTKNFVNNTHSEYAYNDNYMLTELKHIAPNGTDIFAGFTHNYDAVGNSLDANNLQNVLSYDVAKPVTQSEKYTYDVLYRLVDFKRGQLSAGDIPSPTRTRNWQLDGVHNWTQFGVDGQEYQNSINQMNEYDDPSTDGLTPVPDDDGKPDDFMVDPYVLLVDLDDNDKIDLSDVAMFASYWRQGSCTAPDWCGGGDFDQDGNVDYSDLKLIASLWLKEAGCNFAHDKNGNLVDDSQREYYYDYQTTMDSSVRGLNQMTEARDKETGQILGQYLYDAIGRRIKKLVDGNSTVYVYTTNWQAIEEYENSALARDYTYGGGIDEVLTMDRAIEADRFYYHGNALGSIIAVTNNTGLAAERYSYDAYGQPSFSNGGGNEILQSAIGNSYLFTGRRYDKETGIYYYRNRYYESINGRFLQRDPIGYVDSLNLYEYAGSSPTSWVDPYGLTYLKPVWSEGDVEDLKKRLTDAANHNYWGKDFNRKVCRPRNIVVTLNKSCCKCPDPYKKTEVFTVRDLSVFGHFNSKGQRIEREYTVKYNVECFYKLTADNCPTCKYKFSHLKATLISFKLNKTRVWRGYKDPVPLWFRILAYPGRWLSGPPRPSGRGDSFGMGIRG